MQLLLRRDGGSKLRMIRSELRALNAQRPLEQFLRVRHVPECAGDFREALDGERRGRVRRFGLAIAALTLESRAETGEAIGDGFRVGPVDAFFDRNRSPEIVLRVANIYFYKVTTSEGPVNEAVSTSAADTGTLFRYSASDDQYIFNLGTKGLSDGTWHLGIDLHDGVGIRTLPVGLRK